MKADHLKEENLVSIIMPAYNSEDFIGEAIDSVISQTYKNWELIIVDDGSSDNTRSIIKKYSNFDNRILYKKLNKNSGAAVARNMAVDLANGVFIAFLDSDDLWFPNKLITQILFMKKNKVSFTSTTYTKIDERGFSLGHTIFAKEKSGYEELLKTCPGNSTVMYNVEKLGKFKIPDIKKRNDYLMWLNVIKKATYLYGVDEPLGSHRIRSDALSSNKFELVSYHWEIYRNIENLPISKSIYLVSYWIFMTVFKLR